MLTPVEHGRFLFAGENGHLYPDPPWNRLIPPDPIREKGLESRHKSIGQMSTLKGILPLPLVQQIR